jgi:tetratricopeptide (TPR) repeat protein
MPPTATDPAKGDNSHLGARLDCWKEIAAYLGRGERTVKRWETDRGLPAHRVPGAGRTSVYAYTVELDEWLKSRKGRAAEGAEEAGAEVNDGDAKGSDPVPQLDNSFYVTDGLAGAVQPVPAAAPLRSNLTRHLTLAFSGLLLVALGAIAFYPAALHSAGLRLSRTIPALFAKSRPNSGQPNLAGVSDSEKSVAHDLYLKGRYEWSQRTPDSLNHALDDFMQAVVHDPGNAQAYAGIADTYDMLRIYSTMPQADAYPRAIAAARRAVELDDSLPEAHRALAFAEYWGTWNFVDAEKEFRRAIGLNPKDPLAHKWFADALSTQERYADSLEEIDKAQELDPASHSTLADKGTILFEAGKQEEGVALLKQVERAAPDLSSPHQYLMIAGFSVRDYPAYLAEGEKTAETMNDPVLKETIVSARAGYARDRERGLLKNLYATGEKYYAEGRFPRLDLALTCVRLGKKQEALQLLEEAYEHHDPFASPTALVLGSRGAWATLKDEPRYKALIKETKSPPASPKISTGSLAAVDHPPAPYAPHSR